MKVRETLAAEIKKKKPNPVKISDESKPDIEKR